MKLVDIYMASLWREGHIVKTVNSLMLNPEVGSITISCNNYKNEQWDYVNNELKDSKIILYQTNNEKTSNEKLRFINNGNNYYICLADDDLIYPSNYLKILIKGCEKYNAMVSMHGRILLKGIIDSYYRNVKQVFSHTGTVEKDIEVDIASNCGSLFKRNFYNDLDKWYDFCGIIPMDDIYVNYFAKKKGIKRFVLAHQKGDLLHKKKSKNDHYVYDNYKHNDKVQTEFYNKYFINL
jgi:hypothetical protein